MKSIHERGHIQEGKVSLSDQVSLDISRYLESFPNINFAIRILATETSLSEKTIKRLIQRKNTPTYQTLIKLYSAFLDESNIEKVIAMCPDIVAKVIKDSNPHGCELENSSEVQLLKIFKEEPMAAEVYVLAGISKLEKNVVAFRYGQFGLSILERLSKEGILNEVEKGVFSLSKNCPNMDGECLKFLGESFIKRYLKPKNTSLHNENAIIFYAESLNDEGYKKWLKIDTDAFYQKLEIAKDPKYQGSNSVFTFTATDTMKLETQL